MLYLSNNYYAGMKGSLDSEEAGPNRNSADFRIKKAQVEEILWSLHGMCTSYRHFNMADRCNVLYWEV